MHADFELHLFAGFIRRAVLYGIENAGDLVAEEYGEDRRRSFVAAETVVVGRSRNGNAQKILIFVHRLQNCRKDEQKLRVLLRRVAGVQKVFAPVGGKRPVVVLAGAVHTGERLFMQQAYHAVPVRHALHALHDELVVVGGDVHRGIDAGKLMLCGGDLVVLGLGRNAELP